MTQDAETTLNTLRAVVKEFVDERNWEKFHTPKNLVMALAVEAAELMEHFQWLTPEQAVASSQDSEKQAAVGEEMADVLCYLLALADAMKIDLAAALEAKMVKNRLKYPVEEYRGRYGPEDDAPAS